MAKIEGKIVKREELEIGIPRTKWNVLDEPTPKEKIIRKLYSIVDFVKDEVKNKINVNKIRYFSFGDVMIRENIGDIDIYFKETNVKFNNRRIIKIKTDFFNWGIDLEIWVARVLTELKEFKIKKLLEEEKRDLIIRLKRIIDFIDDNHNKIEKTYRFKKIRVYKILNYYSIFYKKIKIEFDCINEYMNVETENYDNWNIDLKKWMNEIEKIVKN